MRMSAGALLLQLFFASALFAEPGSNHNQEGLAAFDKGDYQNAFIHMSAALNETPRNEILRKNYATAARAWANALYKQNSLDSAISILKEASTRIANSPEISKDLLVLTVNKGYNALRNRDLATAKNALADVQRYNREHLETLKLAGEVAYIQHDLKNALSYWQQALTLSPTDTRLAKKINQVKKELGSEQRFSRSSAYQFDIRFDHEALGNNVYDIRSFLMDAYRLVGKELGHYPTSPITVILYKEADFREVNSVSDYTLGLYDGKIRVPLNFIRLPLDKIKGILIHEYTHAVIHILAGGRCPIWLNEGIAMREMNGSFPVYTPPLKKALHSGSLFTLDQLKNNNIWHNPGQFSLAYAQSWIIAEYLFYRWNNQQIVQMLQKIKSGATFEEILLHDMNRTPQQFEREWTAFAREKVR